MTGVRNRTGTEARTGAGAGAGARTRARTTLSPLRALSGLRALQESRSSAAFDRDRGGPDHHHRDIHGGGARAAMFGISDGLVTNVTLILGMIGARPGPGVVPLVGLVALVGGAFSMAIGEYVSMRAQSELFEREIELERNEIRRRPEGERRELARIYEGRGLDPVMARDLAAEMMRNPDIALETHAREELGIDPKRLGSPIQAALSSFATFAIGALLPLLPWLAATGTAAIAASLAIGALSSIGVGAALSVFTGRSWIWSAARQLFLSTVAAAVAFGLGSLVGVAGPL
ncbi:MAG: VIT1/CCC1 transporter family protein [Acidimicrobiales bacterium]